jgi:sugar lactone lactonase YvrE
MAISAVSNNRPRRGITPRFVHDPTWGGLPAGWTDWGYVTGVAVDSQDRVYVLHRAAHPVVVYNQTGDVLAMWGEGFEVGAHGLHIRQEPEGEFLYFADVARHCVFKYTLDGRKVWTLGEPGRVGADGEPFNKPTDVAFAPEGDFYVSDGYGNARVHHYDQDRKLIRSWGQPGNAPGQFNMVHDVWVDTRGAQRRVWVCDRMNNRLQVFSPDGEFLEEKTGFREPNSVWVDPEGFMYVAELHARVTILDQDGGVVGQLGGEPDAATGGLLKPHAVWGDSAGGLYVAEVEDGARIQRFRRA